MKFKLIKRTVEEIETDIEYPIYLYFQGEDCISDEYVKLIDDKIAIVLYSDWFGYRCECTDSMKYTNHVENIDYFENHICSKQIFEEEYENYKINIENKIYENESKKN